MNALYGPLMRGGASAPVRATGRFRPTRGQETAPAAAGGLLAGRGHADGIQRAVRGRDRQPRRGHQLPQQRGGLGMRDGRLDPDADEAVGVVERLPGDAGQRVDAVAAAVVARGEVGAVSRPGRARCRYGPCAPRRAGRCGRRRPPRSRPRRPRSATARCRGCLPGTIRRSRLRPSRSRRPPSGASYGSWSRWRGPRRAPAAAAAGSGRRTGRRAGTAWRPARTATGG